MRAWKDCFGDPAIGAVTPSAAPEGRECVGVLPAATVGEKEVEAGQRVLDGFEAYCGAIASDPLAPPEPGQYAPEPQYEEVQGA